VYLSFERRCHVCSLQTVHQWPASDPRMTNPNRELIFPAAESQ
jgi:hypothetical protein